MRPTCWLLTVLTTLGAAGCGGSAAPTPAGVVAEASHGGTLLPLPGGRGYVEVVAEADRSARAKGRLTAYFYNADGTGAPSPAPADVTFTPDGGAAVALKAKPDASSKAALFESAPGPFVPGRGLTGELAAAFGGEAVKVPVLSR